MLLAPTINLHRSPKAGRNFECYSEDPILSGKLAAAFIRGVQSRGVATTPKHFVANDSEFERNTIDSQVDERTLRELYLLPFELAVKEGSAWGLMSAYNRLNGVFCSEHEWLLGTVLREQWGFDGFVVSDWFAARSTAESARAGLSLEMPGEGRYYGEKLRKAVESGELEEAVLDRLAADVLRVQERSGVLDGVGSDTEDALDRPEDRALIREAAIAGTVLLRNDGLLPLDPAALGSIAVIGPNAYRARIMGGGSAKVAAYRAVSPLDALRWRVGEGVRIEYARGCDINRTTAPLEAPLLMEGARLEFFAGHDLEGDVLASREIQEFDFRAFGAPAPEVPAGPYSFRAVGRVLPTVTGLHELRLIQSGRVRVLVDGEVKLDATEGEYERGDAFFGFGSVEIAAEVELVAGRPTEIELQYCNRDAVLLSGATLGLVSRVEEDLLGEAEALARACDVALVVVGTNDDWETEGRDRDLFELPGDQPELIRRVAAANPRTVVAVNAGAIHDLSWLEDPAATLQISFAGQELGDALVDVLFGVADPGGRMPTSVPSRYEQFGAYLNYPGENGAVRYGEGLFIGHRWHDALGVPARVPFGHGLSYARFEIGGLVAPTTLPAGEPLPLQFEVANVSERPGTEVVQVYVEPLAPRLQRPLRELKAFSKVRLQPGEKKTLSVELPARAFASFDPADPNGARLRSRSPVPVGEGAGAREEAGWYAEPGTYRIHLGRSSADFVARHEVTLEGDDARLPL